MFDPGDEIVQRVTAVAPYGDCRAPAEAKSASDHRRDDVDEDEDEDEETGKEGEKLGEPWQWKNESASSEGKRFTGTIKKYEDIDSMVTDLVKELNYINSVNSNDLLSSVRKVETIPQPRAPSPSTGPFSSSFITSLDQLFAGIKIEGETFSKSPPPLPGPIVPSRSIASSLPPPPSAKVKFKAPQQDPSSREVDAERVDLMGQKMLCALFRLRSKLTIAKLSNAWCVFRTQLALFFLFTYTKISTCTTLLIYCMYAVCPSRIPWDPSTRMRRNVMSFCEFYWIVRRREINCLPKPMTCTRSIGTFDRTIWSP